MITLVVWVLLWTNPTAEGAVPPPVPTAFGTKEACDSAVAAYPRVSPAEEALAGHPYGCAMKFIKVQVQP